MSFHSRLSRRPTESLHIGNDIVITVLGIKGAQVRLGITAPKEVVFDRAEVHARKQREHALSGAAIATAPLINSAASEPRAVHSPSTSQPVENPVAGFSTVQV